MTTKRLHQLPPIPTLRFSPPAWAKLLFLRDAGDTEVGGFAISAPDDLFYLGDLALVRQSCTSVTVKFDDTAVADFFDLQVDEGLRPEQFARVWVHTHPGDCPRPSRTDEETFARVFGSSDWAVMFILAQDGQTYARLQFNVGPGGALLIPVEIDYSQPFAGSDEATWAEEYLANVVVEPPVLLAERNALSAPARPDAFDVPSHEGWFDPWGLDDFGNQDPFREEAWYGLG